MKELQRISQVKTIENTSKNTCINHFCGMNCIKRSRILKVYSEQYILGSFSSIFMIADF